MYSEIKDAMKAQIDSYLQSQGESIDVYTVPYQSISFFPAVALELNSRRKAKKGLGVRELQADIIIWVYVDILDAEDAEEECLRITELVEEALEENKTLGGIVTYLDTDDLTEFGTVQNGEASFLQGSKTIVHVKKLLF
jgi:hypothetical protein